METIFTCKNRGCLIWLLYFILTSITASGQTKYIVGVTNNVFTPQDLSITAGDTLEWQNTEGYHNVNGAQGTYPNNPESFGNSLDFNWTFSHIFDIPGHYDYRCDAHYGLGMVGTVSVAENPLTEYDLTINFSDMFPHVDEYLWIAVIDKASGKELDRKQVLVSAEFSVNFSAIEKQHSYYINFFADHNGNVMYDAPPTDHAWQLELDSVQGDTTLNFTHNTNFTDIMWENKLTISFNNMNPHNGQTFRLWVKNKGTGVELFSSEITAIPEFSIVAYGIENGESYNIDFYADHNGNDTYDASPTDHSWRLELNDVMGDTVISFTHNTNFTDIFDVTAAGVIPEQTFRMYPNPVTNVVTLEYAAMSDGLRVRVLDLTGRLQSVRSTVINNTMQMNVQNLPKGLYLVEIQDGYLSRTHKFIKE